MNDKIKEIEIGQDCLTNAVCGILSGTVSEEDVKENMPDIGEVVRILKEDEFFQDLVNSLVTGKIKDLTELQGIIQEELKKRSQE